MMNQHAAGTLNQFPNLIDLIGRHSELLGTAVWQEAAIGSDDPAIGSDDVVDGVPGANDNILQDDINSPLIAASVTGHEAIGQDDVQLTGHEAIGQDDFGIAQAGQTLAS